MQEAVAEQFRQEQAERQGTLQLHVHGHRHLDSWFLRATLLQAQQALDHKKRVPGCADTALRKALRSAQASTSQSPGE
jgi:hypothetical protein